MFWFLILGIFLLSFGLYDLLYPNPNRHKNAIFGSSIFSWISIYTPQNILGGIVLTLMGLTTILFPGKDSSTFISFVLLIAGLVFLILASLLFFRRDNREFPIGLESNKRDKSYRKVVFLVTILLACGCFWCFFLFYPPFISIG